MALLRTLRAFAGQREWSLDLHVAHIHHHLRPEADGEAVFVAGLAGALELPFHLRDIYPAGAKGNLEAAGRDMRYAALAQIAGACAADCIATAHHADDQLETILMRLVRGAGVTGLGGIAARRKVAGVVVVRPMLGVDHAAAAAFLGEIGQAWREDHTNADTSRWRGRLRAEVLPVLRSLRPGAAVKAAESAQRLREAARLVRRIVTAAERGGVTVEKNRATMARKTGRAMERGVLTEVVRRRCAALGAGELTGREAEKIVRAIRDRRGGRREFNLMGGVRVEITGGEVVWRRAEQGEEFAAEIAEAAERDINLDRERDGFH